MALISQPTPSIRVHSEVVAWSRSGQDVGFGLRMKGGCTRPRFSCDSARASQSWSSHSPAFRVRRVQRLVVAASPPTEDAVVATEPLTKEDLVGYLASGCKPKEKWRIGTEHEKFGFQFGSLRPMRYDQIAELLNGIAERFEWDKILEGDNIIGLKQGKQSISLEPGGQFELSGAPLETLHQTCAEVNSHLYQASSQNVEM